MKRALFVLALLTLGAGGWRLEAGNAAAQSPAPSLQPPRTIAYHFSFPEPQHHWMQVEAVFPDLPAGTLELRMSRSSPGRYSLHDFAKNVYDVHVAGANGREIDATRPDPYGWNVSGHGGSATVTYKIYGDRVDGTYLAVDTTHAHINMPAAIMWARGLDERPVSVTFDQPAGVGRTWLVATQLHGEGFPILNNAPIPPSYTFTAPNLQYLMDSPADFGVIGIRRFSAGSRNFRFALHHQGTDAELTEYAKDVEKIVREEGAVYGEYPDYEPGYYTFIADYLPYAGGDGMEHRNSTVISAAGAIASGRERLLDTVAHEFFHCWNVERIRPKGLEPFDFDRANLSGELWLAEGFTQYYGPLAMQRAGLLDLASSARTFGGLIESVSGPARLVRTAEEMSRMAPFTDGGRTNDRTNWSTTVISYYPFGGAIALAMDLTLRDRSDGGVSLDDFMRAMWTKFGKPGGAREGYVDRPYTIADAEATLGEVAHDRAFAHDFFARYIQGHDVADYTTLLGRAGFLVRKRNAGRAWLGDLRLESRNSGGRVQTLVAAPWPVYAAGLDLDDELQQLDGQRINGDADLAAVLRRHRPGETMAIVFADRTGIAQTKTITLAEDPHIEVVVSDAGSLTPAQRTFRDRWLKSRQ